ncbi:MAG: tripartite tricarboxylate transporter substrate binding protein [Alphaproteobacteria bacterium]|nr:tripartite tricarboxylate transporter substrate binding protein [Alphaproteobacteria bacterium]
MRLPRRRFLTLAGAAAATTTLARRVRAADYPNRPIRWIVSFSAGGGNDIVARYLGQFLGERLGQQILIENRPGAGGNIGMGAVMAAAPDGYTIGFAAPNNAINATLYDKLPFDFARDPVPIGGTMLLPNVFSVHPSVPAKTMAEFIALAKAKPGTLTFASSGTGASPHMSGELLKYMAGIDVLHVPYRGGAPALADLVPGRVSAMFDNLTGSIEQIRAGTIRALGVTSAKRSPVLPDVPTIGEAVPGYVVDVWHGIVAPKGTSPEIAALLNKTLNAVLAEPRVAQRFAELGGVTWPTTRDAFAQYVADDVQKWAKLIRAANIKVE